MMKRLLIPLLLLLLFSMPAHAFWGGLSAKDYPRPSVTFYSSTPISSFQSINQPGTMAISAKATSNENVQNIKLAPPVGNYPTGVDFLFQTCYTQKVATVTYTDTDEKIGTKTFLVLSCPSNHKIRLAPTTGANYKVRHRDVQYDYPLNIQTNGAGVSPSTKSEGGTKSGSDVNAETPNQDQEIIDQLNFYLSDDNKNVVDIQEKNAISFVTNKEKDDGGKIKSFDVLSTLNEGGVKKYVINSVSTTKMITIKNNKDKKIAYARGISNSNKPLDTYRYTFKESGGVFSLTPRGKQINNNVKTLKLVDSVGNNAVAESFINSYANLHTRHLCDEIFDLDKLYLQISDAKANNKKVLSISPVEYSSKNEYYTLTFRNKAGKKDAKPVALDDVRYLNVYCEPVDKKSNNPTTSKRETKNSHCNTKSTITQNTNRDKCEAGKDCSFTFKVEKNDNEKDLPKYCIVGFIQHGNILSGHIDSNQKENGLSRWIFECDQLLKSGKTIDLKLPDSPENSKAYLFPFYENAVEDDYLPTIKKKEAANFRKAAASKNGVRTKALQDLTIRNAHQCDSHHGGAVKPVDFKTEKPVPSSEKGSAGKVDIRKLGTPLGSVDFKKFKDMVFTIKNKDANTGFVLVKLPKQNLNGIVNIDYYKSDFFNQKWWLLNNFPVITYKRWYVYKHAPKLSLQSRDEIVKKYNSYDAYCLRRNITADKTPYGKSYGTCGAYLFFPNEKTGTIDVYMKQVNTGNQQTVLSLIVTNASRIMTQHLDYPEDSEMLNYSFWTTTIPKYDKKGFSKVTVSLGYHKSKSHPVFACAAGNIQKLSADFRENKNSKISSTLQPTRAFIESKNEFAYCSAAGPINRLFTKMTKAYVHVTRFISNTTLNTTIREDEFQGRVSSSPFEIIGNESSGTTTQSFTAEKVQDTHFNDETLRSILYLDKPTLQNGKTFSRTYTTKYDDKLVSNFKTTYNGKGWRLNVNTGTQKDYTSKSFNIGSSTFNTGDLQISFGGEGTPGRFQFWGPVHTVKVIPNNGDKTMKIPDHSGATKNPSVGSVVASSSLTGNVVSSKKFPGASVMLESTKPDFWPGKIFATYSREKDKDPEEVLSQNRIYASLLYKGSMDDLNNSLLKNIQLAANKPVLLSLDKDWNELGYVTYLSSEDDDLDKEYKDAKWKVVAMAYDYTMITDVPQNLIVFVLEKVEGASEDTTSSSQTAKADEKECPAECKSCVQNWKNTFGGVSLDEARLIHECKGECDPVKNNFPEGTVVGEVVDNCLEALKST